jgi:arylsulfatase A
VVFWEGNIEPGTRTDHISAFWDFLPTACDLAGIEGPKEVDGISFLPTLKQEEQVAHELLYWEFPALAGAQAIRKGAWKLVRNRVISEPPGTLELYNLESDPGEEADMAADHPDLVEELIQLMEKSRTESAYFPMGK